MDLTSPGSSGRRRAEACSAVQGLAATVLVDTLEAAVLGVAAGLATAAANLAAADAMAVPKPDVLVGALPAAAAAALGHAVFQPCEELSALLAVGLLKAVPLGAAV